MTTVFPPTAMRCRTRLEGRDLRYGGYYVGQENEGKEEEEKEEEKKKEEKPS